MTPTYSSCRSFRKLFLKIRGFSEVRAQVVVAGNDKSENL